MIIGEELTCLLRRGASCPRWGHKGVDRGCVVDATNNNCHHERCMAIIHFLPSVALIKVMMVCATLSLASSRDGRGVIVGGTRLPGQPDRRRAAPKIFSPSLAASYIIFFKPP